MNDIFSQFTSNRIILILLVIILVFIVSRLTRRFFHKIAEANIKNRIVIKNFIPILNIAIYLIGIFIIFFGILKIAADTMGAIWLSAGVAIGFAFQDILANVFGGLIIIFTRPFNIGDKIQVESYYGEIVDINLLKVKILTPDDSLISIPSKAFLQQSVSNANSGELNCQVVIEMHLPGSSNLELIRKIAREAVYASPYSYLSKPVAIVFLDAFKETSLIKMKIKAYVYDHRFEFRFASDVYERLKNYFNENKTIPEQFYRLPACDVLHD